MPGNAAVLAVHVVAGPAGPAQPAGDQRMQDHLVADGDVGDGVTDRMHPAGVLVADRVGQRHAGLLLPLAFDDVHVGAADAGAADPHDHVERAGRSPVRDVGELAGWCGSRRPVRLSSCAPRFWSAAWIWTVVAPRRRPLVAGRASRPRQKWALPSIEIRTDRAKRSRSGTASAGHGASVLVDQRPCCSGHRLSPRREPAPQQRRLVRVPSGRSRSVSRRDRSAVHDGARTMARHAPLHRRGVRLAQECPAQLVAALVGLSAGRCRRNRRRPQPRVDLVAVVVVVEHAPAPRRHPVSTAQRV